MRDRINPIFNPTAKSAATTVLYVLSVYLNKSSHKAYIKVEHEQENIRQGLVQICCSEFNRKVALFCIVRIWLQKSYLLHLDMKTTQVWTRAIKMRHSEVKFWLTSYPRKRQKINNLVDSAQKFVPSEVTFQNWLHDAFFEAPRNRHLLLVDGHAVGGGGADICVFAGFTLCLLWTLPQYFFGVVSKLHRVFSDHSRGL